ncbi:MAG: hypothetical protein DDT34_01992 [Firmicutes bacterium]|nr:hypothetical protein [Bacillota bacterium]
MLIQSENFQALRFMERRYAAQVNCIYIDPPYNTDGSPISYKNGYRSSTWVSLIENRLQASIGYLASDSVFCVTIDDYQQRELVDRLDAAFSKERRLGTAAIRINPSGRITKDGLAVTHEYALFYGLSEDSALGKIARSERQAQRFNAADDGGAFEWRNFRREGSSSERAARPRRFFPIYVNEARELRVPEMTWDEDARRYDILEQPADSEVAVYPRDSNGDDRVWRWGLDRTRDGLDQIEARSDARNGLQLYYKYRPDDDGVLAPSIWADAKYSATEHGTALLKKILGERNAFSFPKSIHATTDCIRIAGMDREYGLCLDYFAGSGTTGHAVISLNREDGGRRRFILVEMEKYFEEVTLPRIKKVSFAPEWKAGKPERFPTQDEAVRSPRLIKVLRLESYEDALNNLALRRGASLQSALNFSGAVDQDNLKEKYLLRYQLDVESRGSASLLDVRALSDSTAYKLKVKKPGSDESHEVNVDLLETFNWLLGLTVQQITAPRSFRAEFERDDEGRLQLKGRLRQSNEGPFWFRTVTGTTPEGRKTLVIWRKLTGEPEQDNLALEEWFKNKQAYSVRDAEFDLIYVNGDNTLENLRVDPETWKVRLIEEDFHRLMFEGTEA